MGLELIYTSSKKALKPGSVGFCTVAMSRQMPPALAATLESLSGYRHLYTAGTGDYAENPVNFCHYLLPDRGRIARVLARIGAAPADYTGRTNKLAHFIVLDSADLALGGPAWLLGRPGLMQELWRGEPRWIESPTPIPGGDSRAARCKAWQRVTGDAGWAGELLRRFCEWPDAPVHIVCKPGAPTLELFAEALALLPADVRWRIGFSTYFTGIPAAGVKCHWRGIIAGTAAAEGTIDPKSVIDLTRPPGRAPDGPCNLAAREGRIVDISTTRSPVTAREPPITLIAPPELSQRQASRTKPVDVSALELVPPDPEPGATRFFHPHNVDQVDTQPHTRRRSRWILPAGLGVGAFIIVVAIGAWLLPPHLGSMGKLGRAMFATVGLDHSSKAGAKVSVKTPAGTMAKASVPNPNAAAGAKTRAAAGAGTKATLATTKAKPKKQTVAPGFTSSAKRAAEKAKRIAAQFAANLQKPLKVLDEPIFQRPRSGLDAVDRPATLKVAPINGIKSFLVKFPPKSPLLSPRGKWSLTLGDKKTVMKMPYVLHGHRFSVLHYSVWWVQNPALGAGAIGPVSAAHHLRFTITIPKRGRSLSARAVEDGGGRNYPRRMVVDLQLINGRKERIQFLASGEVSSRHLNRPKVIPLNSKAPGATKIASSLISTAQPCLVKESLYPREMDSQGHVGKNQKYFSLRLAGGTKSGARQRALKFKLVGVELQNNFRAVRKTLHTRLKYWNHQLKVEGDTVKQDTMNVRNREKHESPKQQKKGPIFKSDMATLKKDEAKLVSLQTHEAHITKELKTLKTLRSITFRVELYPGGPVLEAITYKKPTAATGAGVPTPPGAAP